MNLIHIAKMIPAQFRDQILETNAIYKAIAVPTDPHMFILFTVWTTFVNPGGGQDMSCTKCLGEILNHFRILQPKLVEQRKEDQLLSE